MREASVYNHEVLTDCAGSFRSLTPPSYRQKLFQRHTRWCAFSFQFFFIIRLRFGAHHNCFKFIIIADACDRLAGFSIP